MNPFYYSPTDPRGPWIYVPGWPENQPPTNKDQAEYNRAKAKALTAGIGVRGEDNGLVKRKAFCSTPYRPLADMAEQDAEIEAWQPAPDTVYWLPLKVEIFEQYIEPPDTIHCNRGGDRKYVRILPNKEEPKPEDTDSALLEARNYLIAEGLDPDEIARDGVHFVHNLIKKIKMGKKQLGEEKREYCDQCDGVGWYEGGGPKIQTICEVCYGTGFKPEEKKEAESGQDKRRCTLSDKELIEAVHALVSKQCKTGRGWQMSVPVDFNRDSDILISELIRRFKQSIADRLNQGVPKAKDEKFGKEFRPNLRQTPDTDLGLK